MTVSVTTLGSAINNISSIRDATEVCRKSFANDGFHRAEMFTGFLDRVGIPYRFIENNADLTVVDVACRSVEKPFVDRVAAICNSEPINNMVHDWRRYMESRLARDENQFRQEYMAQWPPDNDTPQQVNTLPEEPSTT